MFHVPSFNVVILLHIVLTVFKFSTLRWYVLTFVLSRPERIGRANFRPLLCVEVGSAVTKKKMPSHAEYYLGRPATLVDACEHQHCPTRLETPNKIQYLPASRVILSLWNSEEKRLWWAGGCADRHPQQFDSGGSISSGKADPRRPVVQKFCNTKR